MFLREIVAVLKKCLGAFLCIFQINVQLWMHNRSHECFPIMKRKGVLVQNLLFLSADFSGSIFFKYHFTIFSRNCPADSEKRAGLTFHF